MVTKRKGVLGLGLVANEPVEVQASGNVLNHFQRNLSNI